MRTTFVIQWYVFEFHWNDQCEAHIARHNVTPEEVQEAAQRPYYTYSGHNETEILLGRTFAGRYLFVVLSEAQDGRFYVVTAYEMNATMRREFQQKAR